MFRPLLFVALALASPETPRPTPIPFVETRFIPLKLAVGEESVRAREVGERIVLAPTGPSVAGGAVFQTAPLSPAHPFRDALLSWNVSVPKAAGFCVELRVARESGSWSPWLYVGDWGTVPKFERVLVTEGGKIDTDFFCGAMLFDTAQVRVRAWSTGNAADGELEIGRLTVCFSDLERRVESPGAESATPVMRLPVATRSQRTESADLASRICSPTSVAMVLAYRGASHPTLDIAQRSFDSEHDIYGNWPRNVQAAYTFGVPGYLTRIASWREAENLIRERQPIIASIAVKSGELTGAPYDKTAGHLIVITGFDAAGDVHVNDPAVTDPAQGKKIYKRTELERCWLARGGTAYIFLPRQ